MAFNATNLSLRRGDILAYISDSGVRTDTTKYQYGYVTADLASVVEASGYFDAQKDLQQGDIITAVMNCGVGSTPVLKEYIVTANTLAASGHVVIALQTTSAG